MIIIAIPKFTYDIKQRNKIIPRNRSGSHFSSHYVHILGIHFHKTANVSTSESHNRVHDMKRDFEL